MEGTPENQYAMPSDGPKGQSEGASRKQAGECCPEFNPEPWDGEIIEWTGRRFNKDSVLPLPYMPVNYGGVMQRLHARVRAARAGTPDRSALSDHASRWNMDVYLAVDQECPGRRHQSLERTVLRQGLRRALQEHGQMVPRLRKHRSIERLHRGGMVPVVHDLPRMSPEMRENHGAITVQTA